MFATKLESDLATFGQCAECKNINYFGHAVECPMPPLLEAIGGLELDGEEREAVRHISRSFDRRGLEVVTRLFRRMRNAAAIYAVEGLAEELSEEPSHAAE